MRIDGQVSLTRSRDQLRFYLAVHVINRGPNEVRSVLSWHEIKLAPSEIIIQYTVNIVPNFLQWGPTSQCEVT
jgi:hypothetical protein